MACDAFLRRDFSANILHCPWLHRRSVLPDVDARPALENPIWRIPAAPLCSTCHIIKYLIFPINDAAPFLTHCLLSAFSLLIFALAGIFIAICNARITLRDLLHTHAAESLYKICARGGCGGGINLFVLEPFTFFSSSRAGKQSCKLVWFGTHYQFICAARCIMSRDLDSRSGPNRFLCNPEVDQERDEIFRPVALYLAQQCGKAAPRKQRDGLNCAN